MNQFDKFSLEINQIIQETLSTVGFPNLKIKWEWNGRFTIRLGDAECLRWLNKIRFSSILWPLASPQERRATIIHETCHITADYRHRKRCMHGPEWFQEMQRAGIRHPQIYHSVPTFKRGQVPPVPAYCKCKKIQSLSAGETAQLLNRKRTYYCSSCKTNINLL